jgi:hypothetical protein
LDAQQHAPVTDNVLVRIVRGSTERFRDVTVAEAEGYHLLFGCVSGPDSGALCRAKWLGGRDSSIIATSEASGVMTGAGATSR